MKSPWNTFDTVYAGIAVASLVVSPLWGKIIAKFVQYMEMDFLVG